MAIGSDGKWGVGGGCSRGLQCLNWLYDWSDGHYLWDWGQQQSWFMRFERYGALGTVWSHQWSQSKR